MPWYAYEVLPIDCTWDHLTTVTETVKSLADGEAQMQSPIPYEFKAVQSFLRSWELAKEAARKVGWEGDFRHEPAVFWLPIEEFEYGFAFKQDNNCTTYVISPVQLPWLGRQIESTYDGTQIPCI